MARPTFIGQLSDPHIVEPGELLSGEHDTAAYLRAAVAHINLMAQPLDAVVVTGDLVDGGQRGAYDNFAAIMDELHCDWWAIPGNHDDLTNAAALRGHLPTSGPKLGSGTVYVGDAAVVSLQSARPGEPGGSLDAADLAWVTDALRDASRDSSATLLALHHPPADVGLRAMDTIRLNDDDANALAAVLEAAAADGAPVAAVLCGHVHRLTVTAWAGTVVITCPNAAHAIAFDLTPGAPLAQALEPPTMLIHRIDSGRIVTHASVIGDWATKTIPAGFDLSDRLAELAAVDGTAAFSELIRRVRPAIETAMAATGRRPGLFIDEECRLEARWHISTPGAANRIVTVTFADHAEVYVYDQAAGITHESVVDATDGEWLARIIAAVAAGTPA